MDLERLSPQQFAQFREFIYKQCGIRIDEKKVTMLSNRIRRRLRAGQFADFDVYYRHLTSPRGASELDGFLDAITTNETSFFRTPKQFEWLEQDFLSELVQRQRAGERSAKLNIWSAGCANGAEAYSMAICLLENKYRLRDWQLQVLGTDISEENLAAARQGVFNHRSVELVSDERRRKYLSPIADQSWLVRPAVKELVKFKRHNLMQPPAEIQFDCVFIRNVLIYFDQASKQVVIRHLLASLSDGGYLVVGPSEGVHDLLDDLEKVSPLIYRRPHSRRTPASLAPPQSTKNSDRASPTGDVHHE